MGAPLTDWYVYTPEQGVVGPMSWKDLQKYPRNTLAGYAGGKVWYPRCVLCENGDIYMGVIGMVVLLGGMWTGVGVLDYFFLEVLHSIEFWRLYWLGVALWFFLMLRLKDRLGVSFE